MSAYSDRTMNDFAPNHAGDSETEPNVDIREPDVASYLEWLPADLALTWPMVDVSRQNLVSGHFGAGDRDTSRIPPRKAFDSMFDWFSWDAYYAGVEE